MELLNTELDAVNLCLAGIGREPVSSLETADLDSAMARAVIQQSSLDIQVNAGRGWWFNTERNWNLQPSDTGVVKLPNNTLSIVEARATFYDRGERLTMRGNKVYDTDAHTFDLRDIVNRDGTITFSLILALEYEELPQTARSAVAWKSRRVFADDVVGDEVQHQINMRGENRAFAALEVEHHRTARKNYLRDNAQIRSRVSLIGGNNNMYR